MGAMAAGAAAGGGLAAAGAIIQGQDTNQLEQERAAIARQQAGEIASREAVNESLRDEQAYRQKLQFGSQNAGAGKAGTGIGSQLEIQRQTDLANAVSKRDSQFQEQMLEEGASIDQQMGQEAETGSYFSAASSVLGGAANAYRVGKMGSM